MPRYILGVAAKLGIFAHPASNGYNSVSRRDPNFKSVTHILLSMFYASRKGHAIGIPCSLVVALGRGARAPDAPPDLYRLPLPCYIFIFEMIV